MNLLGQALVLTLIGMGVVFASLAVLMMVIQLLNRIFDGGGVAAAPEASAAAAVRDDLPLVLAAAAAHFLETKGPEVYVPEVRRGGESQWARRARSAVPLSRRAR